MKDNFTEDMCMLIGFAIAFGIAIFLVDLGNKIYIDYFLNPRIEKMIDDEIYRQASGFMNNAIKGEIHEQTQRLFEP